MNKTNCRHRGYYIKEKFPVRDLLHKPPLLNAPNKNQRGNHPGNPAYQEDEQEFGPEEEIISDYYTTDNRPQEN